MMNYTPRLFPVNTLPMEKDLQTLIAENNRMRRELQQMREENNRLIKTIQISVSTDFSGGEGNGSTAHGSITVQSGKVACAASGGGAVCAAFGSPSTASTQMAVIEQLSTMHHLSPKELEARNSFIELRDTILGLNDGLDVNEVLYIIDNLTPEWV